MFTKIHSNRSYLLVGAAIFAITGSIAFQTYAASVFDIEFPVAELGNCADRAACKTFCAAPENITACETFAAKYKTDGDRADERKNTAEFQAVVKSDGGPDGKCGAAEDPIKACEAVCAVGANMRVCLAYAIERNLIPESELAKSKKILSALDRGVKPPCDSESSCREKCENPKSVAEARACFAFAKEAGMLPENVDEAKAEQLFKLMESGEVPFKSPREFEKCENPPDDATLATCIEIGTKIGAIDPAQAEMIKKTSGKGPGGCRGKAECEKFCGDPANQEICFKFGEEHGLIPPEDIERTKEGLRGMKEGLGNAPPEVRACLESAAPGLVQKIESGSIAPSEMQKIGPAIKKCFERNMGPGPEMKYGTSDPVKACLEERGVNLENSKEPPPQDIIAECMKRGAPQLPGEPQDGYKRMVRPAGPAPCGSPEECKALCESNPEACKGFEQPQYREPKEMERPSGYPMPPPEGEFPGNRLPGENQTPEELRYPREFRDMNELQNRMDQQYQGERPEQLPQQPQMYQRFEPNPEGAMQPLREPNMYQPNSGPNSEQFPPVPPGSFSPEGGTAPQGSPPQSLRLNPPTLLGFFAQIFLGVLR